MEAAGMALEMMPSLSNTMGSYSSAIDLLENFQTMDTCRSIYSHKLKKERAKFETAVQILSRSDQQGLLLGGYFTVYLIQKSSVMLNEARTVMFSLNEKSLSAEKAVDDQCRLDSIFGEITVFNNELISRLDRSSPESTTNNPLSDLKLSQSSGPTSNSLNDLNPDGSASDHHLQSRKGQLLQKLVVSCAGLFLLTTESQPDFTDLYNDFRLWELDTKSEGLYKAMDLLAPELQEPQHNTLFAVLFRSVIRIIKVLTAWSEDGRQHLMNDEWRKSIQSCKDNVEACDVLSFLNKTDTHDFTVAGAKPRDSDKAALETVKLVVSTLQSSLVSTTRFSRRYSTVQSEDMEASDVARLLDIALDLIGPVKKAFLNSCIQSDCEFVYRTFREQVDILRRWKENYKEDFETKLARNSPSKLASVADAVQNIVAILSKLPHLIQGPHYAGQKTQELQVMMKNFETFVQSLVAIGPLLEKAHAPPSYRSIGKDCVILEFNGEVIRPVQAL